MACGCPHSTTSSSSPFLFKGRKSFKGGKKRGKSFKGGKRKKSRRTRRTKRRRKRQAGGASIFGDVASNAVTFSNSLTANITGNNSVHLQPAGEPYNRGNAYMV